MSSRKEVGNIGEKLAVDFLKKNGYKILARNFYTKYGELDIVALESDCLVFVEVKTRTEAIFGQPEEAISLKKLKAIEMAGHLFRLKQNNLPSAERIDVVSILFSSVDKPEIKVIRGAFI